MNLKSSLKVGLIGFSLILLSPVLLFGQSEKGAILGVVTDPNGAAVPGATVTITNLTNKTSQTLTTNGEGRYEAPFLNPAAYMVIVKLTGFKTAMVNEVVVNVGRRESVNVQLETGDISATVVVADTATPLLQTESASIGTVVTTKQLTDLPSQDRNIYGFLALDSSVTSGFSGNAEAFRLESGGTFVISGTRASSITFKIDGQANTDPTFGTPTITPTMDSVKEFQLQNNAYSAEYEGITQVNIASKAGASSFHGSAFEFAQNDFFQPRNPLLAPDKSGKPAKNRLRFNQFGGTIGGPIWLPRFGEGGAAMIKDRTFFFFSYEGKRLSGITAGFARVLTAAERKGDFSSSLGACVKSGATDVPLLNPNGTPSGQCIRVGQIFDPATTVSNPLFSGTPSALNPQFIRQPFANNQIPSNRLNSVAQNIINLQQPLPNQPGTDLNYLGTSGALLINNQYSLRIDHRFSDSDNIYGRWTWQNNIRDNVSILPLQQKNITGNGRVLNLSWTHLFNAGLVNEFRVGYVRGVYGDSIEESDPTAVGVSNTLLNTLPGLLLPNSLNFGGFTGSILNTVQNTYQIADNVSMVRGRHAFKFGFKIDENRFRNGEQGVGNGRADFNGMFSTGNSSIATTGNRNNHVADLLLGLPSSHSLNTNRLANLQSRPWAVYFQDDWKFSPRVTVNLGLRYEYHQPFRENLLGGRRVDFANGGRLIVADPEIARLANSPLVVCCTSPRVVDADKNDFGPRIGVAFQPFKRDSMVIRVGYGLFYSDSSQFFHWQQYTPFRSGSFSPTVTSFQNPTISLSNLFPLNQFTPTTGSGITISVPGGVNPAVVPQPILNASGLGSYDTPQTQQWSVSLQRQIWGDMVVELNYAGSVSKNLPLQWFFNQPTFSATVADNNSLVPAANPYLRRQFANFTTGSNIVANVLSSNYNAGTAKVTKRFSKGYSFTSTYTWSKNIDQGAEIFSVFSNHAFVGNNLNFNDSKGVSALDVPHRWVTNGTVELPFGKGKRFLNSGGLTDKLVGGWRLSGVAQLQSGLPINPYIFSLRTNTGLSIPERGDLVGPAYLTGDAWDAAVDAWEHKGQRLFLIPFGSISLNYAAGTLGNIPRNFFRAPYGRLVNLSAAKVTRFGEGKSIELRMDMFNVTREVLHRIASATNYTQANALTSPLLGSSPPRSAFFAPHIIQVGARITF
ncbi:MAG TPA: TonB-dependent receptor [Pyrinomonadaceae bacterium]|nr:TonB-dependent receptor [Pyrinomonadaceae bacterium]